jgi:hypothetical protein
VHVGGDGGRLVVLVFVGLVWAGSALAQTAGSASAGGPPAGHLRVLAAQRASTPPLIDGVADDAVWASGAVADDFSVSDFERAPSDRTRVVVLYDDRALYFAFTCFDERPDLIRANQITRDASPGFDDRVTVELDPVHNHRAVSRFTVTARGTQSDVQAGGRVQRRGWKGEWTAAARRTAFGWTAEIAIPIALLDFNPGSETFGINFVRFHNRTREFSEWANLTPQRLPEEAGHLTGLGLAPPPASGQLSVMQYVVGGLSPSADSDRPGEVNAGLDLRYQWRRGITSVVSTRPDFSGVDTDVPDISRTDTERFVRDHRPFFQEGGEFFGDREVFHSGRITAFDVGAKTFGRVEDYQVGVLATTESDTGRTDYVGHLVREVGPAFNVSATLAGTSAEAKDNTTLQLQAGGRVGRHLRVKGNVARTAADGFGHGVRGRGELGYATSHWHSGGWVDHTDAEYSPANGFLAADVIGTTGYGANGGYTRSLGHAWMRRAEASVSYDLRETTAGLPQREMTSIYARAETAVNVHLNAGVTTGTYRPRGATRGEWAERLRQDRFYLASAFYQSPTGQFGYGAQYSWGATGAQDYTNVSPSIWLAPTPHFSFAYSYERAAHDAVQHQHVVSGTWEISSDQSVAARWVEQDGGYYRLSYRRAFVAGLDAVGVYTSEPYDAARFNLKLVWTLLR